MGINKKSIRKKLKAAGQRNCCICGNRLNWDADTSIEHVIPTSYGGTNHFYNLRLAHVKCNNTNGLIFDNIECMHKKISIGGPYRNTKIFNLIMEKCQWTEDYINEMIYCLKNPHFLSEALTKGVSVV